MKNDFSEDFVKDLESKGIARDELEGMQIKIESNGNVTVSGIEDKEVREQVTKLVEEKYSDGFLSGTVRKNDKYFETGIFRVRIRKL